MMRGMSVLAAQSPPEAGQQFVLHGVSWELYEAMLREQADRPVYLTYDNGSLELMSPSPRHELYKKHIGSLLEELAIALDVPIATYGSTTFRRKDLRRGLEPDECYYVRNEAAMRGREEIDLRRDPPPDLVVEIDISPRAVDREAIYAAMGVPEVWRFDGTTLVAMELHDGAYRPRAASIAFPALDVARLMPFVEMFGARGTTATRRAFRKWAQEEFA
jgi:Uma2 family endonuclease